MNPNQTNKKKTSEESKRRVGIGDARDAASVPASAAAERRRRTACVGFEAESFVANPATLCAWDDMFLFYRCFLGLITWHCSKWPKREVWCALQPIGLTPTRDGEVDKVDRVRVATLPARVGAAEVDVGAVEKN